MIPTLRCVWIAALGVPLALVGLFGNAGLVAFGLFEIALVLLFVADRAATADPRRLSVRREVPPRGVQGIPLEVRLHLHWPLARSARLLLRELLPPELSTRTTRFSVALSPRARLVLRYEAVPGGRGLSRFGPLAVRCSGPLGLVERQASVAASGAVRVYPDMVRLPAREAALVHPSRWLAGQRRGAATGEGHEFHELRAYADGDDVRLMDWKASARRGRPVVRDYRAERNQRLLLVLDGGRLMTVRVGDRLRFDWAVQAAGRLARVALAAGDLVGLAVFSRTVRARVEPSRGPGHLGQLAELLAEARPDADEPHLGHALRTLLPRKARRTLVVVFTELADPRAAASALRWLGGLAPRHLGVVVTLADADLERERHLGVRDADEAYRRLAADELWQDYRRVESALASRGARVVRARADALAAAAVDHYLSIKARGTL